MWAEVLAAGLDSVPHEVFAGIFGALTGGGTAVAGRTVADRRRNGHNGNGNGGGRVGRRELCAHLQALQDGQRNLQGQVLQLEERVAARIDRLDEHVNDRVDHLSRRIDGLADR